MTEDQIARAVLTGACVVLLVPYYRRFETWFLDLLARAVERLRGGGA